MKTTTAKGFTDFTGQEAMKRMKIRKIALSQFELYGFEPAETPVIEYEEFIKGKNSEDEAVRDIFKLEDRGKRKLGLRYEFTFQLKRIAKNQKLPYKRYQVGYNFRDEPIRKGRTRQFIQCDADVVGSTLKDEAELLKIAKNIFEKLEMPVKFYINNRKLINEILVSENIPEKNREQVVRELDKLDKLSEKQVADNLRELKAEKILKIFTSPESYFEKYNFYKEVKELKRLAKLYGVEAEFRPFLARGLSYYNGSVFEIWSQDLGVSLSGGGSYLVGEIQSTGISLGLEPISMLTKISGDNTKTQIVSIGQDEVSISLAEELRNSGISTNVLLDKTIPKALEYANSRQIQNVILVGKNEVEQNKFKIKNMNSGEERLLSKEDLLKEF